MNDQHSSIGNKKNKREKRKLSQSMLKQILLNQQKMEDIKGKIKDDTENFQTK